jgi:hypothetical protein
LHDWLRQGEWPCDQAAIASSLVAEKGYESSFNQTAPMWNQTGILCHPMEWGGVGIN